MDHHKVDVATKRRYNIEDQKQRDKALCNLFFYQLIWNLVQCFGQFNHFFHFILTTRATSKHFY